MMKLPEMHSLDIAGLAKATASLSTSGIIRQSDAGLVYLNVDDNYIHRVFPLIQHPRVNKPDYFQPGDMGAHITVIYPEEAHLFDQADLGQEHQFDITQMVTAQLGLKTYYILLVSSPSLVAVRQKYGLSRQLAFRGYAVDLHITVGKYLSVG